jgi:multisubunit Na+/H+ antiporter MnhE subunit
MSIIIAAIIVGFTVVAASFQYGSLAAGIIQGAIVALLLAGDMFVRRG